MTNLLETIQKNLGYPPLKKIDPNTDDTKTPEADRFAQAALPAVLTAFYKYVKTDDGAKEFLRGDYSTDWASKIFLDNAKPALEKICDYAKHSASSPEDCVARVNDIADETVKAVKEELPDSPAVWDLKVFFENQRQTILLYLSPSLHMGEVLHDNTLDDATNKMEGPISSLIHNIGSAFSQPVTEEEVKK